MKTFLLILLCGICLTSFKNRDLQECDIAVFYKGITPDTGTKALTSRDELDEIELILIPIEIDKGNYVEKITRKGSNLYKIEGKNIYIETKYCYEYSYSEEVVLKVESTVGFTKGKIIF
jgi:hypothetical protein